MKKTITGNIIASSEFMSFSSELPTPSVVSGSLNLQSGSEVGEVYGSCSLKLTDLDTFEGIWVMLAW